MKHHFSFASLQFTSNICKWKPNLTLTDFRRLSDGWPRSQHVDIIYQMIQVEFNKEMVSRGDMWIATPEDFHNYYNSHTWEKIKQLCDQHLNDLFSSPGGKELCGTKLSASEYLKKHLTRRFDCEDQHNIGTCLQHGETVPDDFCPYWSLTEWWQLWECIGEEMLGRILVDMEFASLRCIATSADLPVKVSQWKACHWAKLGFAPVLDPDLLKRFPSGVYSLREIGDKIASYKGSDYQGYGAAYLKRFYDIFIKKSSLRKYAESTGLQLIKDDVGAFEFDILDEAKKKGQNYNDFLTENYTRISEREKQHLFSLPRSKAVVWAIEEIQVSGYIFKVHYRQLLQ